MTLRDRYESRTRVVRSSLGQWTAWVDDMDGTMSYGNTEREATDKAWLMADILENKGRNVK